MKRLFFLCLLFTILLNSCQIFNPSVMLRTPPGYKFDEFTSIRDSQYLLAPNDLVQINIYANKGDNKIDNTISAAPILVEFDGTAKIPTLGRIELAGLTRRQAEDKMEELLAKNYVEPFVTMSVVNRQVYVFPGSGQAARPVTFVKDNMNLLEALAAVGGITRGSKARNIKIIRGDFNNPKVYKINLATIEGMKEADLALQSGDIIYVTPTEGFATIFNQTLSPYITLVGTLTSIGTTVALIISLTK